MHGGIAERLDWYQWSILRRLNNFDPEGNLIIVSSPRGGSSWITDLVSLIPRTVVLWEPLHLDASPTFRGLGFGWQQYIPEDAVWAEARAALDDVLRGKLVNRWTCMRGSKHRFLTANKMVVKFCHAVALLPWLTRAFNFHFEPIYLVRHPFAVVASQMQWHAWDDESFRFSIPSGPFCERYSEHAEFLRGLRTKAEVLLANWCLANQVPLSSARNNQSWVTVYYEHLLTDPRKEIDRIFGRWCLPVPENIFSQIGKPSQTTKRATFLAGAEKQLSKWQSFFTESDIEKMLAILKYFGIKQYGEGVYPIPASVPEVRVATALCNPNRRQYTAVPRFQPSAE